jgi:hypothetical protein
MAIVSMSGLDLSGIDWSWEPPKKKQKRKSKSKGSSGPFVFSDIQEFRSPVDGSLISSRSSLRAHEQRHGIKQCGDFKKGEIIAKENKRIAHSLEQAKGATSRWE